MRQTPIDRRRVRHMVPTTRPPGLRQMHARDVIPSIHERIGRDKMSGNARTTEFGRWLIDQMAKHDPPLSRIDLANRIGVPGSTVSRWIVHPGLPQTKKLALLAEVFRVDYGEVLFRAGHRGPVSQGNADERSRQLIHPLAQELDRMLDPRSPLNDKDREQINLLVDRVLDPSRAKMRRQAS